MIRSRKCCELLVGESLPPVPSPLAPPSHLTSPVTVGRHNRSGKAAVARRSAQRRPLLTVTPNDVSTFEGQSPAKSPVAGDSNPREHPFQARIPLSYQANHSEMRPMSQTVAALFVVLIDMCCTAPEARTALGRLAVRLLCIKCA